MKEGLRVILVEPDFPIPAKSKNHKNFLPIGLLKIAAYLKDNGASVKLIRGRPSTEKDLKDLIKFCPDEVWITSLFTYWAPCVKNTVQIYREIFPQSKIIVGGIYASLFDKKEVIEYTGCDEVIQGVISEAEKYLPDYSLLNSKKDNSVEYQIVHSTRGCNRQCSFCGTWKIEPKFTAKASIKEEIFTKKIIFYDNNILMNPYIEDILEELIELKRQKKIIWCESQSGFDGRFLLKNKYLAKKLKEAGFRYPRIAWDGKYSQYSSIKKQVDALIKGGYKSNQIFIFVLYNWDIPFEEMEMKRLKCWNWKVQISDCRYRPLDQLNDNYNPRANNQTNDDYHIHYVSGWSDKLVKEFRKNIRMQNICVRYGYPFYSKSFEHKIFGKNIRKKVKEIPTLEEKIKYLNSIGANYWIPDGSIPIKFKKEDIITPIYESIPSI